MRACPTRSFGFRSAISYTRTVTTRTFTAALAKTSGRDGRLLNAVRYDRAIVLDQLGQRKRARADLERIYAADPAFEDVKERLAAMP